MFIRVNGIANEKFIVPIRRIDMVTTMNPTILRTRPELADCNACIDMLDGQLMVTNSLDDIWGKIKEAQNNGS